MEITIKDQNLELSMWFYYSDPGDPIIYRITQSEEIVEAGELPETWTRRGFISFVNKYSQEYLEKAHI